MERMPEFDPRPWNNPDPENRRHLEIPRLKMNIERILAMPIGDPGLPPTSGDRLRQLELILEVEPQRTGEGILRYLVTSGLAVEMLTGFEREHHDIDLVIMDPDDQERWDLLGTDNVTPGEYWADMRFDPDYLEANARVVETRRKGPAVEVVHPAIIMVQKSSDAFGRSPRPKDVDDVVALVTHWINREGYTRKWNPIVQHSLNALPQDQLEKTLRRIRRILPK
jgi:hypothetical protein